MILDNMEMSECWLGYDTGNKEQYKDIEKYFGYIHINGSDALLNTAAEEITAFAARALNITPVVDASSDGSDGIVLDCTDSDTDGFAISSDSHLITVSGNPHGILYGVFRLLNMTVSGKSLDGISISEQPAYKIRMINHWDNASGEIERGYAGKSIFFSNDEILKSGDRIDFYARMLASVGINALTINNVNVHHTESYFIAEKCLKSIADFACSFRKYGIKLFLSANYASPIEIGGLDTADPLDSGVQDWWNKAVRTVYSFIPDFGGFLIKADSENRPGPFTYGRNHADGANMLARALEPFSGTVIWRCFVYNCHLDWRDRSIDRAKAAYDCFKPLDGKFMPNVMLQIKNGPMDFQIREATSPLFGAMPNTNKLAEFQIAQEYTGQQKHVCFLARMWKECLDFNISDDIGCVKDVIRGVAAVSNIGDSFYWTGHPLAQANLYAFGRLGWNPSLTPEQIAEEYIRSAISNDTTVVNAVKDILCSSRRVYEKYTTPLGIGWMVTPHYHYGPSVDGYEYSPWGTYHYADRDGMGVDRTVKSGTGYTAQYFENNMKLYEDIEICPDDLLLFFHHVPYTHVLHCGKTVMQYFYDSHFEGVEDVQRFIDVWSGLSGKIDKKYFDKVSDLLSVQYASAVDWRDQVNTYFYRKSGIDDNGARKIYK